MAGRSIVYNYFRKEKDPRQEYSFDVLYNTQQDYAKSSYLTVVAPLVKKAVHGDSTMAIFGGLQSLNLSNYLLSQTFMQVRDLSLATHVTRPMSFLLRVWRDRA